MAESWHNSCGNRPAEVQVSRPAASRAVRELSDKELVEHKAYGYVDLTAAGQSIADNWWSKFCSPLLYSLNCKSDVLMLT